MNHQIKTTIVEALMKVVESAPTRAIQQHQYYQMGYQQAYQSDMMYQTMVGVSAESFGAWIEYVRSVLAAVEPYVDDYSLQMLNNRIITVVAQPENGYEFKTNTICQMILEYARNVVKM